MGPPSTSDDAICLERKAPGDLRLSVARATLSLPSWLQTDLCAEPELSGSGETLLNRAETHQEVESGVTSLGVSSGWQQGDTGQQRHILHKCSSASDFATSQAQGRASLARKSGSVKKKKEFKDYFIFPLFCVMQTECLKCRGRVCVCMHVSICV